MKDIAVPNITHHQVGTGVHLLEQVIQQNFTQHNVRERKRYRERNSKDKQCFFAVFGTAPPSMPNSAW
jgi:hypothetical protein